MKVTLDLLQEFLDLSHIDVEHICQILSEIGLEVEGVSDISVDKGVVVAKVIEKIKHPNSEKLSICKVDTGGKILQVICGAQNVELNQFVAFANIGSKINGKKINKATLLGTESFGMICSASELGFPKINDGILILDDSIGELKIGKSLSEYSIFNTKLLDIAITPNRGDCLCVLGIARDLKASLNLSLKTPKEYLSDNQIGIGRVFQVGLKNKVDSSLIYKVVDLSSKKTPLKIALNLALIGNLSNCVVRNYLSYTTYISGVLINAYDASALNGSSGSDDGRAQILRLFVSKNEAGFDVVSDDEFASNVISIIGVSPPKHREFGNTVIFEASYTRPDLISQLLHDNDVESDANLTYLSTRGSNPDLEFGINLLCLLLGSNKCFIYNDVQEIKQDYSKNMIRTNLSALTSHIGLSLSREVVSNTLKQLGFYLEIKANDDSFNVIAPDYRHDIQSEQDLAEEILRIYGVDKIPPIPHMTIEKSKMTPDYLRYKFEKDLIAKAIANGFREMVGYVFCKKSRLQELGFETLDPKLDLANPINSDLDTLRSSLLLNLLDTALKNQDFGIKDIALCEAGSIFDSKRNEHKSLAFLVSGNEIEPSYPHAKGRAWEFFSFCRSVSNVIGDFEIINFSSDKLPKLLHPFQGGKILKDGSKIGVISKLNPSFGLQNCFVCEVNLDALVPLKMQLKPFSKLPKTARDLSILIDRNISFSEIKEAINALDLVILKDFYALSKFGDEQIISLSLRLILQGDESNLNEEQINGVTSAILECLKGKFNAELKL
ncbi:MAG: phenylalanine--tRNA ligase subunit beta [Helicobacter sp.]|nr:phenylalanine--tRNA ligase subunit beta [Helicobacter sp.]